MKPLALVTAALCVLMLVVGVLVIPTTAEGEAVFAVAFATFALAYVVVGALVAVRRPRNSVGWLMLLVGVLSSIPVVSSSYAGYALFGGHGDLPAERVAAWVGTWMYTLAIGAITLVVLVFPGGGLPGWRRVFAIVTGLATVTATVAQAILPGGMDENGFPGVDNPFGLEAASGVLNTVLSVTEGVNVFTFVVAVASIFVRLRSASGVECQQLKWFAYSTALFLAALGMSLAPLGLDDTLLTLALIVLGLLSMPLAIGAAVLRYRLYDIDFVINRTLVYTALTGILVTAYLGSILLFRVALTPFTEGSDLAVAGSTLAVAALFRPVRSRIQAIVDRRFYRRRYDAARTLDAFTTRLRHELDLEAVGADLHATVLETVQPAHVSLWLRPQR